MQKNRGFTLIELLVTIAVLAIIATMAAPAFGNLMAEQKLNGSTRELVMAINQAKYTATNPGPPVVPVLSNAEKAEVIKSRIISVQIDAGVTIGSTSATSILLSDIGSTSAAQTFNFCK